MNTSCRAAQTSPLTDQVSAHQSRPSAHDADLAPASDTLPDEFELDLIDEALGENYRVGGTMRFSRSDLPEPGDPVLVEDSDGNRYIRYYEQGSGTAWRATGKWGYMPLESERDGLRLLAVGFGYCKPRNTTAPARDDAATFALHQDPARAEVVHDAVCGLVEVLTEMTVGVEMTAPDFKALRKGTQAAYDRAMIVLSGISDGVETAESLAQRLADSALHNPADRTVPMSVFQVDIANGESIYSKYRASYLCAGDPVEVFAHDEQQWRQAVILGASYAIDDLLDGRGESAKIAARKVNSIVTRLLVEDPSVNLDDAADTIFGAANWWKDGVSAASPPPADLSPTPEFARAAPHWQATATTLAARGSMPA